MGMPRLWASLKQRRVERVVDHIEDEAGVELVLLDGQSLLDAGHAAGRGVDERVELVFGEQILLERLGVGFAGEGDGFFVGAIDDEDFRALIDEAEDGGAGRSASAEDDDARALERMRFSSGRTTPATSVLKP